MSFASDVNETRSLFGLYAIMGTPMVMSFDIRDDALLLPRWDILTNEEVLAVNQDPTAAVGTLVAKFSAHPADEPDFAWAVPCNGTDPSEHAWRYVNATKQLMWRSFCLDASGLGGSIALANCSQPSSANAQSWLLDASRLWQATAAPSPDRDGLGGVGTIALAKCAPAAMRPGQQWKFSVGDALTTNVQANLTTRMGGCWEITGCASHDDAEVGTTYGCKPVPKRCTGIGDCDCNGAWAFNPGNKTITSVMSGKCLEVAAGSSAVVVSACTGKLNQQWSWTGSSGSIESVGQPGRCIDDGDFPAPAGTTGNCATLTRTDGGEGPGLSLSNPGSSGSPCIPANKPAPGEAFALDGAALTVSDQCVAGLRGRPSPYGPMQLWAKPLVGGAVAVLLANRGGGGGGSGTPVSVTVSLSELPGGAALGHGGVVARDVWAHHDLPAGTVRSGALSMAAAPGQSQFFVLRPASA